MLFDTRFDPLNSFRAPFLLKRPRKLFGYYQFNLKIWKSGTAWLIRPDWNQPAFWFIRQLPDWSAVYLIEKRKCLIDQAAAR